MNDESVLRQRRVDDFFDRSADYWSEVYRDPDIEGIVYRERQAAALRWIDELDLQRGARVLEVGCGAGLLTVELARRGFAVTASDTSSEMLEQAKTSLAADAAGATVEVVLADVHRLPFGAGSFEMVVALGVLPWLHDPTRGVREMARVLGREQCLVLSADNLARLNAVSDPLENPLLQPLMPMYVGVKVALGLTPAQSATRHLHLPADVDRMLRGAGLAPARRTTIGYGPFTFRGRTILTPRRSLALHRRLQRAAAEHPQLRRHGWHYLVAACKGEI